MLFFSIAALVLITDQVTKFLIRTNLTPGQSIPEEGRFRLSYSTNPGGVFGLPINPTFALILALIVAALIIWLYLRWLYRGNRLLRLGLGLILGGAVGNLIDRIRFGVVTDFIDVRLWGDFHWPAFNLADASLTIGIFILAFSLFSLFPQPKAKIS